MSDSGTILVTGATGNVGSAVIQHLIPRGANIRALQHQTPIPQEVKDAGVEVVAGDLMKPEILDAAFNGVDVVFLYTPLHPDAGKMASNGIAAARRNGSPRLVRLSEASPEPVNALRIGLLQAETNAEVEASGLPYTSLRPTQFMQNTMSAAHSVALDGMIYMPLKDGKQGMIAMGMSEWLSDAFCEYFENYSEGGGDFTTNDVEKLTGRPAISYDTFAQDFAQYFNGG